MTDECIRFPRIKTLILFMSISLLKLIPKDNFIASIFFSNLNNDVKYAHALV